MAPIKYTPLETQPLENGNNLSELLKTRRTKQSTFSRKIAFAGFAVATLLFLGWRSDHLKYPSIESTKQHQTPCSYSAPKKNIWADLDEQEYQDVLSYLYTVPNNLNLTAVKKAGPWDNHIAIIEILVPNKTEAVKYLDTESVPPARYARVIVNHGASDQAGIDEYMVGPLPASKITTIAPLSWTYNSGRNSVKNPLPNNNDILAWFADIEEEIADVIADLIGDPLMALSRLAAFDNGTVGAWARVNSPSARGDAWSLLAQGLFCRFDITGRDSSKWAIHEWYYNGVLYESTKTFRAAWKSGELKKTPPNRDGSWTASEPNEEGLEDRDLTAPVMIHPGKPRYKLDEKERHVSWMGWSFYLNSLQAIGLGLWDVKFRGERILYELGLQEAMAHYAGADPLSAGMYWLDTMFGMGFHSYELVPGYDCPAYATYMPMTFHQGDKTIVRPNSLCVFEWTASDPIQRHTTADHVTVSRNNYLIVRTVATVGNYDYTLSYIFYLDGSMEVKVQASGYIFGAYHGLEGMRKDLKNKGSEVAQYDYGYQIHNFVSSSMHDHGINFKADFDVAGTKNTLYRVDVAPYQHTYEWEDVHRSTMRLNHHPVEQEVGLDWPANSGALYVVLNNESTNAWGEKRGYKITPGTGMGTPPHLTINNSTALKKSAGWAYHDLWVVKHHDQERRSASEYNAMEPEDPLIDFDMMIDGESTVQEDLVMYFNLGTHHIPQSGDVPNTLMHWSASSVMFVPHNFHDRDPSRDSAQGVKLTMKDRKHGGGSDVKYFGGTFKKGVYVGVDDIEPNLTGYQAPEVDVMDLSWNSTLAAL